MIVTTSNCTPLDVYSRPFVLTSTVAKPLADAVVLHTTADALTYAAGTIVELKRHIRPPDASDEDVNPLPNTVTGVPPSATPREGHTADTEAIARYVKDTPLDENCWPFIDTSNTREPAPDDGGAAHST